MTWWWSLGKTQTEFTINITLALIFVKWDPCCGIGQVTVGNMAMVPNVGGRSRLWNFKEQSGNLRVQSSVEFEDGAALYESRPPLWKKWHQSANQRNFRSEGCLLTWRKQLLSGGRDGTLLSCPSRKRISSGKIHFRCWARQMSGWQKMFSCAKK